MPIQFEALPVDVLLHVFRELDINDIVLLRKTCRALEGVTRDRSVWHEVLSHRFLQPGFPVPGLFGTTRDISGLSTEDLERLAVRAHRFWLNWTSSNPQAFSHLDIRPTRRPWTHAGSNTRNLAASFLSGTGGRYFITLSLFDSSSDRENRRYSFECWDLNTPQNPELIAELLVSGLLGYAFNSLPGHRDILAVTRRDHPNQLVTTTYTIDFTTPGVDPWFRRTNQFRSYRNTLGLHGSYFLSTDADRDVRLIDAVRGHLLCTLRVPIINADPTLHLPEHQCLDFEIVDDFIVTFCKQWVFLYQLPPLEFHEAETADERPHSQSPRIQPIATYKWRWRIDTITVNHRRSRRSSSRSTDTSLPQSIDLLIRFDTWYPWPVNIIHHFVLPSNPSFSRAAFSLDNQMTFPYLASQADAPFMAHSIPSPLRLFTPSDMALGSHGTAVWLDASTDQMTPSQAGDHGQRIACKLLRSTSPAPTNSPGPRAQVGAIQGTGAAAGAPPDESAFMSAMALDNAANESARVSNAGMGVLHVQETHEPWNRLAVNEEEGQVAVGYVDGRVSVFTYAPPLA